MVYKCTMQKLLIHMRHAVIEGVYVFWARSLNTTVSDVVSHFHVILLQVSELRFTAVERDLAMSAYLSGCSTPTIPHKKNNTVLEKKEASQSKHFVTFECRN
jgi:hypothetical protein